MLREEEIGRRKYSCWITHSEKCRNFSKRRDEETIVAKDFDDDDSEHQQDKEVEMESNDGDDSSDEERSKDKDMQYDGLENDGEEEDIVLEHFPPVYRNVTLKYGEEAEVWRET